MRKLSVLASLLGIAPKLAKGTFDIRNKMEEIMVAAANGDL
jgi:hypothetical protein